jgi:hypothetical protein
MIQATQQRKKPFSSFTYREAFKHLGVTELKRWVIEAQSIPTSDFFRQRLERLQRFDLESLEVSVLLGLLRSIFRQCEKNLG